MTAITNHDDLHAAPISQLSPTFKLEMHNWCEPESYEREFER
jgi:hypothetical protein